MSDLTVTVKMPIFKRFIVWALGLTPHQWEYLISSAKEYPDFYIGFAQKTAEKSWEKREKREILLLKYAIIQEISINRAAEQLNAAIK